MTFHPGVDRQTECGTLTHRLSSPYSKKEVLTGAPLWGKLENMLSVRKKTRPIGIGGREEVTRLEGRQ